MIIYDQTRLFGWGILFHASGSALFTTRSLVPALFSATLAGVVSNVPALLDWFEPRIQNGSVIFSSIQFLVSLMVINRVREAGARFNATQDAYIRFYSALFNLALFVTMAVDGSSKPPTPEWTLFRMRFLRWVRALHVLSVEEFQGYESPKYRMGTLLFTEEILLFGERRKPTRLMQWMAQGLMKERARFEMPASVETNIWRLMEQTYATYANTRRMSSQIYPYPLAQSALMCCILYALLSPFAFGTMLPLSTFLAPCVAFASVWLTFSFNLAAEMLEWPFDGRNNNLPMNYYSIRFIKDIGMIEFGSVAPIITYDLDKLMPPFDHEVDFVIPRQRPYTTTKKDLREWLERAQRDVTEFAGRRRELRHRLKPINGKKHPQDDHDKEILSEGITEMRAQGMFQVLW